MAKKSVFENPKKIKEAAVKKPTRANINMNKIKQYAELSALQVAISNELKKLEVSIKDAALTQFINNASETHQVPASFDGKELDASVNVQLRKRLSSSVLTDEDVAVLDKFNISYSEDVMTPELYGINPEYANNKELLDIVSKTIENIVPEDFIVKQAKTTRKIVTAKTLEDVFAMNKINRDVVKITSFVALSKPMVETFDVDRIIDDVKDMIDTIVNNED